MPAPVSSVAVFVDAPENVVEHTRSFWSRVTGWPVGSPWPGHPEFTSLVPPVGDAYVHVQRIEGLPRVHFDLAVHDIAGETDRLVQLGAARVARHRRWQTLTSPGGLPFCLFTAPAGSTRPGPVDWPGGHRSRLVQVCVDIPIGAYDIERAFWRHATGWEPAAGRFPEFDSLAPPDGCPVRLLLQRLGADNGSADVRAHIDLGTNDVAAEAERVRGLGARLLDDTHPWSVLRDPAGLEFCVTPRSPD